ncbi:MAG: type II secretion system F family protein [Gemmatimonadota bacterium]|nr:type II secretion system F family protein [Gemmatimonadota bacterium]
MLTLMIFVVVALAAFAAAGYAGVVERRRRVALGRALGTAPIADVPHRIALVGTTSRIPAQLRTRLVKYAPTHWVHDPGTRERLLRAGFESDEAPLVYAGIRVALLVALPATAVLIDVSRPLPEMLMGVTIALAAAWFVPLGVVDGMVRRRQERIRRAIPDGLDLLLVCVEAGSSVESAIQRVGRDMLRVHPELAGELAVVVRKTKAGMPRADALRGLYTRTGVDELRLIGASIVQSERWGTSIAKVLRVSAETLRRKRKQTAERHASTAPIKMTIPLVTMILPALFVTLLGPSLLTVVKALRGE